MPHKGLLPLPEDECRAPGCPGDVDQQSQQCGSADGTAFSFYVAKCPGTQKRFGDNCFEELQGWLTS